jgi:hypothetical protein
MQPGTGRYLLYASQVYALAVLRPLEQVIRRRGGRAAWFFDGPGARYLRPDESRLRTVAEVREFDPVAVFVPGNSVPDFFPGIKVEVFHGFSVGKRSERRGHFRIRGLFDLYCTQGRTTTPQFRDLAVRHGHFHVVETGWPKTDPLFRSPPGALDSWRTDWPVARPLILFASTFTRSLSAAPRLLGTIRDLADRGAWNWLVTLHPKMPPDIVRGYRTLEGPRLRYAEADDVVPLLRAADVMVSDTSSVVYEFLLQHKPDARGHGVRRFDPPVPRREVERAGARGHPRFHREPPGPYRAQASEPLAQDPAARPSRLLPLAVKKEERSCI